MKRLVGYLCAVAHALGHPYALLILAGFTAGWMTYGRGNIGWDGWLGVITMVACIVIQASQNRDTAAIKAQLEELIRATQGARDELADLDDKTEAEIEELRKSENSGTQAPRGNSAR